MDKTNFNHSIKCSVTQCYNHAEGGDYCALKQIKVEAGMKNNKINMKREHIEQKLSQIGAQIANAIDSSCRAEELANLSEFTLIAVQREIEALYVSLQEDDPPEAFED